MASSSDWSGERGQSWRDHLGGLEATLEPVNAAILNALDLQGAQRIIDVGCGGGGLTRAIADRGSKASDIVGLDISDALVEAARLRSTRANIN